MKKATQIRNQLNDAITKVCENRAAYCTRPGHDYTRVRKLPFDSVIRMTLSMVNHSLQSEIMQFFNYNESCPTKSAYIQQRQKISAEAFRAVFDQFSAVSSTKKRYHGYRLLACDGTDVNLPRNPDDSETSTCAKPQAKSYNILHINALYDLVNAVYADYSIDFGPAAYEKKALFHMVQKLDDKRNTVIVADRGYGYLNSMNYLSASGLYYVLRIKDTQTQNSFLASLHLPDKEFDQSVSCTVTWHRTKNCMQDPQYLVVSKKGFTEFSKSDFVPMSFRVCRFQLPSGGYECLVTNLPEAVFSAAHLKDIYHMRWGIETSFRDLKYSIGMMYFHAKKLKSVLQEIHAAMLMMNYCALIIDAVPLKQKTTWKYLHKTNFAAAVGICRSFYSSGKTSVLNLMHMSQSLIRPDRQYPRYLHDTKPAKPFTYRAF